MSFEPESEIFNLVRMQHGADVKAEVCEWIRAFHWRERKLLSTTAKSRKTSKVLGVRNVVLNLSPSIESPWNLCPWATTECARLCLKTAGRNRMRTSLVARLARTILMKTEKGKFTKALVGELEKHAMLARKAKKKLLVRLNNLSDVVWEWYLPKEFWSMFGKGVYFYDYTKSISRAQKSLAWPLNYHLTYSYTGTEFSRTKALKLLASGGSVAVVFAGDRLPGTWKGWPVIDGDSHDNRLNDPPGSVVGLRAKGAAKSAISPFVEPVL